MTLEEKKAYLKGAIDTTNKFKIKVFLSKPDLSKADLIVTLNEIADELYKLTENLKTDSEQQKAATITANSVYGKFGKGETK